MQPLVCILAKLHRATAMQLNRNCKGLAFTLQWICVCLHLCVLALHADHSHSGGKALFIDKHCTVCIN